MSSLPDLGWNPALEKAFAPFRAEDLVPARVAIQHPKLYTLYAEAGELLARVSGRLRHDSRSVADFPVTGDWVAIRPRSAEGTATIHAVLPRRSRFTRKSPGDVTEEQILAANVDTVFLVMGLDGNYNPRRLERYLALAWESGADPVVLLTKPDLCPNAEERKRATERLGIPVLVVSPRHGEGLDSLAHYLVPGKTLALLGSSGVGKSTLVNRLLGEERLATRPVRESDDRGRHTTTHRELIVLPGGGLVIDTPGLREIQLWESADVDGAFARVTTLAEGCRFTDCGHDTEPGCAVTQAVAEGSLDPAQLASYQKLKKELEHANVLRDLRAQLEQKRKWKSLHKLAKRHKPRE
jgi:ribosome biogenesis GTPase